MTFFGQRDGALGPADVIVHSGPAERADVTGLPNLFGAGSRYRWRFIACGVAVTYRTDAAGLRLSGRVVQRRTPSGIITLVQLVSADGLVVASVRAVPSETIRQMVIASTYNRIDDLSRHVYPPGVCWCTPAGVGHHVNEDGSLC